MADSSDGNLTNWTTWKESTVTNSPSQGPSFSPNKPSGDQLKSEEFHLETHQFVFNEKAYDPCMPFERGKEKSSSGIHKSQSGNLPDFEKLAVFLPGNLPDFKKLGLEPDGVRKLLREKLTGGQQQ